MSDDINKQRLIGDPPKLPNRVAIQVAYGSIRVRLSRSLVTVSSVVLAVTFLLVVLGGEISSNAVFTRWSRDIRPAEDAANVRLLLTQPRDTVTLITHLRDNRENTLQWAADLDITVPEFTSDLPSRALVLVNWLERLRPSQRYLIVRNQSIGSWLLQFDAAGDLVYEVDDAGQETGGGLPPKVAQLIDIGSDFTGTRLPMPDEAFASLANDMPELTAAIRSLQEAERQRLEQVVATGGAQAVIDNLLAGADDAQLQSQGMPLSQLILHMDSDRREELVEHYHIDSLRLAAQEVLGKTRIITDDDGNEEALPPLPLAALGDGRVDDHPHADDIHQEILNAIGEDGLEMILANQQRRRTLDGLRSTFTSMNYDPEEGKERTMWLVLLSLLVCIVGIVNSMMMAVTERFREIATMKCLGAMDSFILKTFMIESGSVGFVGAVLGAVIGVILVLLQSTTRFGASFWAAFPADYLALAALASLLCGLFLTIFGALLPAYKAARMHPIEAMRLEG
ncbi:MAG: ABC transporter permease [Planctomycetota bacterium]|nr:MAG: ABC transporter permease [Planctomycetota bacterium]